MAARDAESARNYQCSRVVNRCRKERVFTATSRSRMAIRLANACSAPPMLLVAMRDPEGSFRKMGAMLRRNIIAGHVLLDAASIRQNVYSCMNRASWFQCLPVYRPGRSSKYCVPDIVERSTWRRKSNWNYIGTYSIGVERARDQTGLC
jgi:hypothetical protein